MRSLWLILVLCLGSSPSLWAAPDYHQVRRDLLETMKEHDILYQACLQNLRNYKTPGYRALDVVGYRRQPHGGPRLRLVVSQGALQETRDPYNLAIEGAGYFLLSDGSITRSGDFRLDRQGRFRLEEGLFLLGYAEGSRSLQPIQISDEMTNIEVGGDGKVMGTALNGDGKPRQLAQIILGQVEDGAWLARSGSHLSPTPESGPLGTAEPGRQGMGILVQGYIEYSNVNPLEQVKITGALSNYSRLLGMPLFDAYTP